MKVWICQVAAATQGRAPACRPENPHEDCGFRNVPVTTGGRDIDEERRFVKAKEEEVDESV